MKWTRAAREMRCETVDDLVQEDPTRSLRQLKAYLAHLHGIEVNRETVANDLRRLGYRRIWARGPRFDLDHGDGLDIAETTARKSGGR